MTVAHYKLGLQVRNLFHVRIFGNLFQFLHPMRNGFAILLFNGWKVRRWSGDF